jgi:hypothetical protein
MRFGVGYWTHDKFMDVCIHILKVSYQDHKRAKLRVRWLCRGYEGDWYDLFPKEPRPRNVIVQAKDYGSWRRLTTPSRTIEEVLGELA